MIKMVIILCVLIQSSSGNSLTQKASVCRIKSNLGSNTILIMLQYPMTGLMCGKLILNI
ncbi:hypothetical protein POTOM_016090 [Populus tomentosa]|uniref:Uncharacterized protein n=1 Tax=Populus tomentosa TaxID=118781 RepID=A0A8X8A327_POPTO|nr:hypothetical protein POTOM_016090 [Populus tomentosa]